jgi:hypothetical protein
LEELLQAGARQQASDSVVEESTKARRHQPDPPRQKPAFRGQTEETHSVGGREEPGHSSLDQVQEYLDEVDQERAAEAAMTKLENVPEIKTATSSD